MRKKSYKSQLEAGEFFGEVPKRKCLPSVTLTEVVHDQRFAAPYHVHERAFFQFLVTGCYQEKLGSKTAFLDRMSVIWHPPGRGHSDEIGPSGCKFLMIELRPALARHLEDVGKFPDDLGETKGPLAWLAFRQYKEFCNWGAGSTLISEGLVLEMVGHLMKVRATSERQPPTWLVRIVEKLNDEFTTNFSTKDLAAEVNVHQVHLAAVFRKHYHQTIGEYLQGLRVAYASKLLLDGKLSLVQIANLAGFSDQSHFNRIFKRVIGTTPRDFSNQS